MIKGQNTRDYYWEIIKELKAEKGKPNKFFGKNYSGNTDPSLHISIPTMRKIAKGFVHSHQNITLEQLIRLLNLLYQGKYDEEKQFGGKLLQYYPQLRSQVKPSQLNFWLDNLNGWAQVDSLCQSVFTDKDMLVNWKEWKKVILEFSKSKNVNKRRASLVLLTGPVRQTTDDKFAKLGFLIISSLKKENDILITKAISWLLREMIKNHKEKVYIYVRKNRKTLPKIAVRETERKLETGVKN